MMETWSACTILLLLHTADCGRFEVITPVREVVVVAGEDIILPCFLKPNISAEHLTVEWFRPLHSVPLVHLYKDGRDDYELQNPTYRLRTSIFKQELKTGNTSLKLSWVRGTDEGTYNCNVRTSTLDWYDDSSIEVVVEAEGSQPEISIEGHRGTGVGLVCESRGWHPQPEMQWQDSDGVTLSDGHLETLRDYEGLYTVRLKVTVQETGSNIFTCTVQQRRFLERMVAEVNVPGELFPHMNPWIVAIPLLLCVSFIGMLLAIYLVMRHRKKGRDLKASIAEHNKVKTQHNNQIAERNHLMIQHNIQIAQHNNQRAQHNNQRGELNNQLAQHNNQRAQHNNQRGELNNQLAERDNLIAMLKKLMHVCELTLDPNTANRELSLSEENRKVTCSEEEQPYPDHPERFTDYQQVLCREGLSGCCYWEVEWSGIRVRIGVTYEGISRKGVGDDCVLGYNNKSWSLDCLGNSYSAQHNKEKTDIPVLPSSPSSCSSSSSSCSSSSSHRVGVYLDWPAGSLSFYTVSSDTLTHLHTFNTSFTEPLYPGFGVGYDSSVSLCRDK